MVFVILTAIALAGAVSAALALVASQLRQRHAFPEEEAPIAEAQACALRSHFAFMIGAEDQ